MKLLPEIYLLRRKPSGTKVRIVYLGSRKVRGIYFEETYGPVLKLSLIWVVLAMVSSENLEFHKMYVVNAFLHGDLD